MPDSDSNQTRHTKERDVDKGRRNFLLWIPLGVFAGFAATIATAAFRYLRPAKSVHEEMWNDYNSLPAEAQRQVADFIAFLRQRYGAGRRARRQAGKWEDEPFVGMWRDREDMQDSTGWVRHLRRREWAEPGG